MIGPIIGLGVPYHKKYDEIRAMLILLGIAPTGNLQIDKARLEEALFEETLKAQKKENENNEYGAFFENCMGAQILGEQNKIFFKL